MRACAIFVVALNALGYGLLVFFLWHPHSRSSKGSNKSPAQPGESVASAKRGKIRRAGGRLVPHLLLFAAALIELLLVLAIRGAPHKVQVVEDGGLEAEIKAPIHQNQQQPLPRDRGE